MQQMELPNDLVTMTEAARRLKLNKSTVSRQVERFGVPVHGDKISIAEFEAARKASVDPGQQRAQQKEAAPGFQSHRTDLERTKAIKAGIELAQLQGTLLDRREVEDFMATAARELREGMMRRWRTLASELAGLDVGAIENAGIAADELLLAAFADAFEKMTLSNDAAPAV